MNRYVALLRAVNVGGTGKLPMADLRALAEAAGFARVQTYIASGNLLFDGDGDEAAVKAALERALHAYAGKATGVLVRTGAELAGAIAANPYPDAPGNRVMAIFLDHPPPRGWMDGAVGRKNEHLAAIGREIFVHYPEGQADTKLRIPVAAAGTARNLNTVAKLAEMASAD